MNLYEISSELMAALDAVHVDEETGEVVGLAHLDEVGGAFDSKAESTALYIKNNTAMADSIANEIKALQARKKSLESRNEWLKNYLTSCLDAVGKTQFETAKVRLSFRKSQQVIADPERVPVEYLRKKTTVDVDKTAIKNAIKSGAVIEGAAIVEVNNLQIK